jgi:hypothetical protein
MAKNYILKSTSNILHCFSYLSASAQCWLRLVMVCCADRVQQTRFSFPASCSKDCHRVPPPEGLAVRFGGSGRHRASFLTDTQSTVSFSFRVCVWLLARRHDAHRCTDSALHDLYRSRHIFRRSPRFFVALTILSPVNHFTY